MTQAGGALRRPWVVAALILALIAGMLALLGRGPDRSAVSYGVAADRPVLMLITSLPLIFGEGFGLEAGGSKALEALERRYRVVPIGVSDTAQLGQGGLLLMAHPLAQPAEALVDLDRWVRAGGRVLILADPALDWPSERPLGDRLRPPPAYADTGLLGHWGLTLDSPDQRGPSEHEVGERTISTRSAGTLRASDDRCAIDGNGLVARCRLGKGRATVIADADFLDSDRIGEDGEAGNFELLTDELDRLGH